MSNLKSNDMVKLIIRDDDTNFFTKLDDLEYVYRDFDGFPVSFAVIPEVLDVSTKGLCSDTKGNTVPRRIGENKELCDWLRTNVKEGNIDILLHGINHSYHFINGKRYAEMSWRDGDVNLEQTIRNAKEYLESLLDYKINVFVAPSNEISKKCLNAVTANGLNFSGIVPINFQRDLSIRNLACYMKRWGYRIVSGLVYPGVLVYSDHYEINACPLRSLDYLQKMYSFCEKHNLPMAINVHYWYLRDNPTYMELLRYFIMDYAIPRGAVPTRLSDVLK